MPVHPPATRPPGAFPADPEFAQLEIAADSGRMLEVFRSHLKPVPGKSYRIEGCTPFRFRCRQSGKRCVLQYTLRLVESGSGRARDQWVTGVIYAQRGEAERLWREMRATDPRSEIPEPWQTFEPVDFIPDLDMLVQVFPCDRRVRHLGRVLGGGLAGVEPLLLGRLAPGWRQDGERTFEPTRYRTELGAALRLSLAARPERGAGSKTLRCYVKVYRDERGTETLHLLRAMARPGGAKAGGYWLVEPLAYLSEMCTLVLEEAPGESLQQILLRGGDAVAAARLVARATVDFHRHAPRIPRPHGLGDQLDDVRKAAALVRWAVPEVEPAAAAIVAALTRGLEEVPPAPIHRDLKPDHVFVSGDRVTFIDLDSVAMGDPVRDTAHLFAYVIGRVGLDSITREQTRAVGAAFVAEYFAHVPEEWRARFPIHCAGALLEVASGIFRHQRPGWREKMVEVVAEARAWCSPSKDDGDGTEWGLAPGVAARRPPSSLSSNAAPRREDSPDGHSSTGRILEAGPSGTPQPFHTGGAEITG